MYYAPHILEKRTTTKVRNDYGELDYSSVTWKRLGKCRCDDNTTDHFQTDNGGVYTPKYKIVSDRYDVSPNDYIRVLNPDGSVRGEGRVFNSPKCNYLNYMCVYV